MSLLDLDYDLTPEFLMLGGNFVFYGTTQAWSDADWLLDLDMWCYHRDMNRWFTNSTKFKPWEGTMQPSYNLVGAIQRAVRCILMDDYMRLKESFGGVLGEFSKEFTKWFGMDGVEFMFMLRPAAKPAPGVIEVHVRYIVEYRTETICRINFKEPE